VEAPLARRPDGSYAVDLDAFTAGIRERTRFFLLCNPHNPVGRVFTRDELTSLAQVCLRRGLAIVADEIHCELTLGASRHTPIASLDPEIAERTITLMAPSKTFNLAGLKCSVAIIPNASLREKFIAGRIDLVQTVNVFGYTAAFAAYRDGQPRFRDRVRAHAPARRDDGSAGSDLSRLAGLPERPDCRRRSVHLLPGEGARGLERWRPLRPGRRRACPAQLRLPARDAREGAGPDA
jgi:aspartate/methionine/tyrosine aminotransferase